MNKNVLVVVLSMLFSSSVFADYYNYARQYEVTVTNVTRGQSFTPILSSTHSRSLTLFELGDVATSELATLAESGNPAPLRAMLDDSSAVVSTEVSPGLLLPGNAVTFEISGSRYSRLSLAAMLIPTNDSFMSLDAVKLPRFGSLSYFAKAYDAGSESNDELCANIPGPVCQGAGPSPEDAGEGYVSIAPGIHGEADLKTSAYDWRDAVAKVTITRIR